MLDTYGLGVGTVRVTVSKDWRPIQCAVGSARTIYSVSEYSRVACSGQCTASRACCAASGATAKSTYQISTVQCSKYHTNSRNTIALYEYYLENTTLNRSIRYSSPRPCPRLRRDRMHLCAHERTMMQPFAPTYYPAQVRNEETRAKFLAHSRALVATCYLVDSTKPRPLEDAV